MAGLGLWLGVYFIVDVCGDMLFERDNRLTYDELNGFAEFEGFERVNLTLLYFLGVVLEVKFILGSEDACRFGVTDCPPKLKFMFGFDFLYGREFGLL